MQKTAGNGTESRTKGASRPPSYRAALRRLSPGLLGVAGISALLNILMLTGSVYMLQVYDRVLASGSVPTLLGLFAIVVVLYGFMAVYDAQRARILSRSGLKLSRDLGPAGFRALWSPGKDRGPGPLRDIETLRGFLCGPVIGALCDLPFVPLYLAVLFLIHPWLGWLTIGGALIAATLAWITRRQGRDEVDPADHHLADATFRQSETVAAMGMGAALSARWSDLRDGILAAAQPGQERVERLAAMSRAFRLLLQSSILTLGAFLVIGGQMSAGMIIAASVISGRALAPTDQITGQWRGLARALAAHRRLSAGSLDAGDMTPGLALPDPRGHLVLSGVNRLAPAPPGVEAPHLLRDISFEIAPDTILAVLGPSGAGKSTLARLLAGAARPDRGELRLDGATLDQWDPARLGRQIGYLPQRVDLLPGTIRDNIARFDPETTDDTVLAAARATGIHEMILRLPQGYDTTVGRPGDEVPLSGGQMQRLGLARAICGKPALVVLDEPDAHLDEAGEAALAETLGTLRDAGSTVVVVTHRARVLAEASHLLYLKDGQVALFGPRDEILARAGEAGEAAANQGVIPARRRAYGPQRRMPILVSDREADLARKVGA